MRKGTVIIDNVVGGRILNSWREKVAPNYEPFKLVDSTLKRPEEGWFDKDSEHTHKNMCELLLRVVNLYYPLDNMIGYDYWTHFNSRPNEHEDKDEVAWLKYGISRYPICSVVFYLLVENVTGGELVLNDDTIITPKNNRLVIFRPGLTHSVNQYDGNRCSVNINPWDTPLYS